MVLVDVKLQFFIASGPNPPPPPPYGLNILPGPLALLDDNRPSLNITALSYSVTI